MNANDVELFTLVQAKTISGIPDGKLEHHVYRDLGMRGYDAIELYENIEKKFGVSIRPITERSVHTTAILFERKRSKTIPLDPTLQDIIDFVVGGIV